MAKNAFISALISGFDDTDKLHELMDPINAHVFIEYHFHICYNEWIRVFMQTHLPYVVSGFPKCQMHTV